MGLQEFLNKFDSEVLNSSSYNIGAKYVAFMWFPKQDGSYNVEGQYKKKEAQPLLNVDTDKHKIDHLPI